MDQMTNEETDTALILEGELKRRVREVVGDMLLVQVEDAVQRRFAKEKEMMLLEISLKVGHMLRDIEREGRQPLWVTGPEAIKTFGGEDAIREQTPSV
jgi:microcystin degradation protein MlrC